MKNAYAIGLLMCCLLTQCGQKDEQAAYIGTWEGGIRAIQPFIKEGIAIHVIINDDNEKTYSLNALYAVSTDTALRHNGVWRVSSDTIFLDGRECAIYDTTLKATVPLQTCSTIPVRINIKNDVWSVALRDLAPVAEAFRLNLNDPIIQQLLDIDNSTVDLVKKQ